jgi:arabinan endo-1,5-alpha-L-arabinosidase
MNGNRWVGTGHNTVFQDAAGDWWTIYHAVDQNDPFFETAARLHQAPGAARRDRLGRRLADGQRRRLGVGPQDARSGRAAGEKSRHKVRLVATQDPAGCSGPTSSTAPSWTRPGRGSAANAPSTPSAAAC